MQDKQRNQEIGEQFISLVREFPIGTPVYTSYGEVGLVVGYYRTRSKPPAPFTEEEVEFMVQVKFVGRFETLEEQTTERIHPDQLFK